MNSPINMLLIAVLAVASTVSVQAADGFDRYLIILEREPFGAPPPTPQPPPPPPTEEEPPWAKMYRLCSVYESENQEVQVALVDNKTHKPVMLTLGADPVEGIVLVSVNLVDEEAVLTKDGQQVTMKMEASKAPPPKAAARPRVVPRPTTANRPTPTRPTGRSTQTGTQSNTRRGVIRAVPR